MSESGGTKMRHLLLSSAILLLGAQGVRAETTITLPDLPGAEKTLTCEVFLSQPQKKNSKGEIWRIEGYGRQLQDAALPEPFDGSPVGTAAMIAAIPQACGPMLEKCVQERAKRDPKISGITAENPQGNLSCSIGKVSYQSCTYHIDQLSRPKNPVIKTTAEGDCAKQIAVSGLNFYRKLPAENFSSGVFNCYRDPAKCAASMMPKGAGVSPEGAGQAVAPPRPPSATDGQSAAPTGAAP